MDKSWMNLPDRFSQDYIAGVNAFIEFARQQNGDKDTMLCPCQNCMNISQIMVNEVRTHLILYGIQVSYKQWVFHGEQVDLDIDQVDEPINNEDDDDFEGLDMIQDLLGDIQRGTAGIQQQEDQGGSGNIGGESSEEANRFDRLLTSAQRELYPGCKSHSRLSFLLKLVHLKDLNHWSNKSFEMLLKLMKEALPAGDSLPATYYEAKKMLRDLGLGYESIDACFNDCVLFWKELEGNDECPVCKESRWKEHKGKIKRVPRKVLRYFPLIPRLQRLFMNKEIASDLRYHSDKRIVEENVLRHPSDGEAWKDLDRRYPWLAQEPRHLRLGLATDGFNPFGTMSSSYSVWPVIIVVYNLPPWKSMKEPFMLMPLLILGKKAPGRDIDVYLRPLVEELKLLFNIGVVTYDAFKGDTFNMRAIVLWTINDLPALGTLFGYATMGYKACPICLDETYSQPLRSKIGFLGHRRYLPIHHRWRKSKNFNGKNEEALKPKLLSGNQIFTLLQKLDHLQGFKYGKHPGNKKRKASQKGMEIPGKNFSKLSILFELPYWKDLKLRHNLDVMHIEKNICDSLLGTLLNIDGKTKDTLKARMDLEDMKIRKELHLQHRGSSVVKPHACYTLSRDEKHEFFQFIESICFPDGFAANISKGVSYKEGKITGLKSHDLHILLQRILPIGMRGFLHEDLCQVLLQLGSFFCQLCSKTLKLDVLEKLEKQIVIVLCKLEMILPPAFFDVIVHLAVHLPEQARLGGPVQYRWMFFVERLLGCLKGMMSNRARPEGSIAESYVIKECSTFCSMYLHGIETRFNREERNYDGERPPLGRYSVFSTRFRAFGHKDSIILTQDQYDSLCWYVLNNCEELQQYIYEHEDALVAEGTRNVPNRQCKEFANWFRKRVIDLRNQGSPQVSDCLYALAIGPHKKVDIYSGCIVGGIRFLTKKREEGRKTQNSGVCVEGPHKGKMITYYGILTDVYVLSYPNERQVVLFKCEWYDLERNKPVRIDNDFISINLGKKWYIDDSFVLVGQVNQVFYVADTKLKGNWHVVQKVNHRHLFDQEIWTSINESDIDINISDDIAFQDEEGGDVLLDETFQAIMLHRVDVRPEVVTDPKEIAALKEQSLSRNENEEEAE